MNRSIASLGSLLTPEIINNIERNFLSPYYKIVNKSEKEHSLTPLLEDFDSEITVYVVNFNSEILVKFLNYIKIFPRTQENK